MGQSGLTTQARDWLISLLILSGLITVLQSPLFECDAISR
jgi:hypothetical protein